MNYLKQERATLKKLLPGLGATLPQLPLMEIEGRGNQSIATFRHVGAPDCSCRDDAMTETAPGARGVADWRIASAARYPWRALPS
jgi:hypothetical protein